MSLFKTMTLTCPACATENHVSVVGSINADRRPDYRDAILSSNFQDANCTNCDTSFRTEPDFNYLDMGHGQWIAALPARLMIDYLEQEDRVKTLFESSFGEGATPEARKLGASLAPRLTFGWPALREKIFAREHDIDDIALECMKTDLIRRLDSVPLAPGIELRLVALEDDRMDLIWVNALTEELIESLQLSRALYDAIVADPKGWAPLQNDLTDGPFIDMQKFYMGDGRTPQK